MAGHGRGHLRIVHFSRGFRYASGVHPRRRFTLPLPGGRSLELGARTLIMGILNVTPDSFSDGGRFNDPDRAYARALELDPENRLLSHQGYRRLEVEAIRATRVDTVPTFPISSSE